jgi:hypothetical protein
MKAIIIKLAWRVRKRINYRAMRVGCASPTERVTDSHSAVYGIIFLRTLSLVLWITLSGCLSLWQFPFWANRPAVETLGNFARLTYTNAEWGEYDELHYRGERLSFADPAHQFGYSLGTYTQINALITFPLPSWITTPVFVVNVGDLNHDTLFFLVREEDGLAAVDYLCRVDGDVTAAWLDTPSADVTVLYRATRRRVRLEGEGRWLLLNEHCILDVQTLQAFDKRYALE